MKHHLGELWGEANAFASDDVFSKFPLGDMELFEGGKKGLKNAINVDGAFIHN